MQLVYTVYQITNTVNKKIYIGVHKTTNPHDRYLGSGLAIKDAIAKYGRAAFIKEVLYIFETQEEAYAKEKEIVNEDFVARNDTYNMVGGGSISVDWTEERKQARRGSIGYFRGRKHTEETKKRISEAGKKRPPNPERIAKSVRTRLSRGLPSFWKGKQQTVESNRKRSQSHLKVEKIECPHCHKQCDPGNAKLWHFDNCKLVKLRNIVTPETRAKLSASKSRAIVLVDESGVICYTFPNSRVAAEVMNCVRSNIIHHRRTGGKLLDKYTVHYEDEYVQ